ncbi:hypothetical protein OKW21_003272 [Catalinimonas alkaloidigena]|uniref:hypothetical protein n=1 Tax=Catalinimonas alkaloidigena TaxID=1075417 RepID=UPI002406BB0A|nr:hypothetical protein [Catalinimonas alkaloidigena]MDF9798009.1 hypothetical protein [Catalinimonas alkaloidigena]
MVISIFLLLMFVSIPCFSQYNPGGAPLADEAQIRQSISNWDIAWEKKDVSLAIQDYAEELNWTNVFGDRVQSRQELEDVLSTIFSMGFVMSGKNNYGPLRLLI